MEVFTIHSLEHNFSLIHAPRGTSVGGLINVSHFDDPSRKTDPGSGTCAPRCSTLLDTPEEVVLFPSCLMQSLNSAPRAFRFRSCVLAS